MSNLLSIILALSLSRAIETLGMRRDGKIISTLDRMNALLDEEDNLTNTSEWLHAIGTTITFGAPSKNRSAAPTIDFSMIVTETGDAMTVTDVNENPPWGSIPDSVKAKSIAVSCRWQVIKEQSWNGGMRLPAFNEYKFSYYNRSEVSSFLDAVKQYPEGYLEILSLNIFTDRYGPKGSMKILKLLGSSPQPTEALGRSLSVGDPEPSARKVLAYISAALSNHKFEKGCCQTSSQVVKETWYQCYCKWLDSFVADVNWFPDGVVGVSSQGNDTCFGAGEIVDSNGKAQKQNVFNFLGVSVVAAIAAELW